MKRSKETTAGTERSVFFSFFSFFSIWKNSWLQNMYYNLRHTANCPIVLFSIRFFGEKSPTKITKSSRFHKHTQMRRFNATMVSIYLLRCLWHTIDRFQLERTILVFILPSNRSGWHLFRSRIQLHGLIDIVTLSYKLNATGNDAKHYYDWYLFFAGSTAKANRALRFTCILAKNVCIRFHFLSNTQMQCIAAYVTGGLLFDCKSVAPAIIISSSDKCIFRITNVQTQAK